MTAHTDYLRRACDETLIGCLPATLRQSIDDALAKGASKAEILRRVKGSVRRRSLVVLVIEAYLDSNRTA